MTTPARRTLAGLLTPLVALLAAGCVGMPEDGPVVETASGGEPDQPPGIYIDPLPPTSGASAPDIVTGFLDAMTAAPVRTDVARQFLTKEGGASWNPEAATITYTETAPPRGGLKVSVTLGGADRLDERGSWLGPLPRSRRTIRFPMTRESGEWRIETAPNALIVPASWFEQRFRQVSVYFFDPTGTILIPEPVFVPRGEQLATVLTEALLQGPGNRLGSVSRSFIPDGLAFGLSVPVSDEGVADISLRGEAGPQTAQAIERMVAQLTWTLRQEPGITAFRVSIGDQQITSAGGDSRFSVDEGAQFDPTGFQATSLLYGLQDGRLVSGPPGGLAAVDGPMGGSDLGVRSIGVDLTNSTVAGVSGGGDRVLMTSVRGPDEPVREIVSGAESLLRPAWDFAGRVWLVDRTSGGAAVSYVSGLRPRAVTVPGVTGRRVTRFLVSRDGSRLVAVVRRPRGDRLMVSRIKHDQRGRVVRVTPAEPIAWEGDERLRAKDVAWNSPTEVVVLQRLTNDLAEVRSVSVDGAPAGLGTLATTVAGRVLGLASSPVDTESLYAVTRPSLIDLTQREIDNAPLDPAVSTVGYVG